ncbi:MULTISPECIES: hypothetical protein [unclassified Streptomyces]|uniref:hypothetical protein n=1 Tax=unclassified Streptomyces TaxID=2593676 RepID=UPI003829970B
MDVGGDMGGSAEVRAARRESVVVAEFGALEDFGGRPVRFAVRRGAADGTWLVEITPHLLGVARAEDVRNFALGILGALSAGAGESDFLPLYEDGYAEVQAVVGFDEGLPYMIVDACFDFHQDQVGTSPSGEPLYADAVGGAHLEAVGSSRADAQALEAGARALLAALDA